MPDQVRKEMVITFDYFCEELTRFFDLCGKKSSTVETIFLGWKGVCYVGMKCQEDPKKVADALMAAQENMLRRLPYFEMNP